MTIKTADRLVELRKSHKLSQEALAEKLGVSRQAVSKWERGESSPDTDNLIALANIYGISLDSLLEAEKEEKTQTETVKEEKKSVCGELGKRMFKFPFPLLIVAFYVALNFVLHLWHPLWLMFILIPIYYHLAGVTFVKSKKAFLLALPIPELVIMMYLILGFAGAWAGGALIFIIIPIYYWVVAFYKK